MSNRLDQEREARLEPKRIETCKAELEKMGFEVTQEHVQLNFMYKGSRIQFWPYSGWHTGKTIVDGRGFQNLVRQLHDERPRIEFNPNMYNGGLDFSPESIAKEDAKFHSKNVGVDKDGHFVTKKQPQTLNIISVKAPLKLWPRLIWAKLRGKR